VRVCVCARASVCMYVGVPSGEHPHSCVRSLLLETLIVMHPSLTFSYNFCPRINQSTTIP
jgi:hypothetical protein